MSILPPPPFLSSLSPFLYSSISLLFPPHFSALLFHKSVHHHPPGIRKTLRWKDLHRERERETRGEDQIHRGRSESPSEVCVDATIGRRQTKAGRRRPQIEANGRWNSSFDTQAAEWTAATRRQNPAKQRRRDGGWSSGIVDSPFVCVDRCLDFGLNLGINFLLNLLEGPFKSSAGGDRKVEVGCDKGEVLDQRESAWGKETPRFSAGGKPQTRKTKIGPDSRFPKAGKFCIACFARLHFRLFMSNSTYDFGIKCFTILYTFLHLGETHRRPQKTEDALGGRQDASIYGRRVRQSLGVGKRMNRLKIWLAHELTDMEFGHLKISCACTCWISSRILTVFCYYKYIQTIVTYTIYTCTVQAIPSIVCKRLPS